jgi:hypothetical protein
MTAANVANIGSNIAVVARLEVISVKKLTATTKTSKVKTSDSVSCNR